MNSILLSIEMKLYMSIHPFLNMLLGVSDCSIKVAVINTKDCWSLNVNVADNLTEHTDNYITVKLDRIN